MPRRKSPKPPEPPRNAVLKFPDGRELPVTLLWAGYDEHGRPAWRALVEWVDGLTDADLFADDPLTGMSIYIDVIPRNL